MDADFLVSFPGLGIEDLPINRVAFSIGGFEVYWYGAIITVGIIFSLFLAIRESKKFDMNEDFLYDNFIVIVLGALVGARAYFVIFSWDQFRDNLMGVFDVRQGGMAFYGGVIGAMIAMAITHAIKKQPLMKTFDFLAVYLPLGQAIGRWGNFINQEAFGVNTDLPWGMISNGTRNYLSARPELGQDPSLPVHPTFLYESIANIILFIILHRVRAKAKYKGTVVAGYMVGYGLIRFFIEGIRTDALFIGDTNLRSSQILSAVIFVLGIAYFIYIYATKKKVAHADADAVFEQAAQEQEDSDADNVVAKAETAKAKAEAEAKLVDAVVAKQAASDSLESAKSKAEEAELELEEARIELEEAEVEKREQDIELEEAEVEKREQDIELEEAKVEKREQDSDKTDEV